MFFARRESARDEYGAVGRARIELEKPRVQLVSDGNGRSTMDAAP